MPSRHVARRLTSHDVAREAGLSQSTVSRALRGDPRVTAETRERVLAAAQRLGYTPNALGRNLVAAQHADDRHGRHRDRNPFYPNLIAPLHDELAELGYRMALFTERLEGDRRTRSTTSRPLRPRHRRRGADDEHARRHGAARAPPARAAVHLPHPRRRRHPRRRGHGRQRARRVADGGARSRGSVTARIGAIFGPGRHQHGPRPRARLPRRARRRGGRARRRGRATAGPTRSTPAARRWRRSSALDDRPTAVVCFNDLVAIGALNAARAAGLRVPEDISITGWDDLPMASWEICQLTTVRQSMHEMARAAARLIVERVEGRAGRWSRATCSSTRSWSCARRSARRAQ